MGVFVIVSALFLLSIVAFTGSDFAESASAVRTWIG